MAGSTTDTRQVTIEPELVNVSGAQESIPPGWESIPRLLKRFTNSGSEFYLITPGEDTAELLDDKGEEPGPQHFHHRLCKP